MIVLTHNGKMPSEGGLRWGYQVGNRVFPILGEPYTVRQELSPAPEGASIASPGSAVIYARLKFALHSDGECVNCYKFPNFGRFSVVTDQGTKLVVKCSKCGTLMKPLNRE